MCGDRTHMGNLCTFGSILLWIENCSKKIVYQKTLHCTTTLCIDISTHWWPIQHYSLVLRVKKKIKSTLLQLELLYLQTLPLIYPFFSASLSAPWIEGSLKIYIYIFHVARACFFLLTSGAWNAGWGQVKKGFSRLTKTSLTATSPNIPSINLCSDFRWCLILASITWSLACNWRENGY